MGIRWARVHRDVAALASACVLAAGVAACDVPAVHLGQDPARAGGSQSGPVGAAGIAAGIHKIKHVIVVMQENRSFDSYFGTYPGADGIPMKNGVPTVCVPNPAGAATPHARSGGRPLR